MLTMEASSSEWAIMSMLSLIFLILIWKKLKNPTPNLPPGPWRLPLIGSMHHLIGGLPHHKMKDLARKHGPIMHLKFGELTNIIISSPEAAQQVLKTHDAIFAQRPQISGARCISYDYKDITFSYGDYWRQLRKITTMELLAAKRVESFRSIRDEETTKLIKSISSTDEPAGSGSGSAINLMRMITSLTYRITSRTAFGKILKGEDVFVTCLEKIMMELGRGISIADAYPSIKWLELFSGINKRIEKLHQKLDQIVQDILNQHRSAGTDDQKEELVDVLLSLKLVIKESLRLHPPVPLLIPRECTESCVIDGYDIPVKSRIMVNAWAMGRDPKYWDDADEFKPERFADSSFDFRGNKFEYLPFGAGRRSCPGILFGLANVDLPLAKLLYHFDWKLTDGLKPENLDMTEEIGITTKRKFNLCIIPTPYHPPTS